MNLPHGRSFGATIEDGGVRFRVWTAAQGVELEVEGDPRSPFRNFDLRPDGIREIFVPGLGAGCRYGYRLNGEGPFPDLASQYQPESVHALSEVIDPAFAWTDADFQPPSWSETVFYELHCGTFTPEGTFRAAAERLPYLRELGVTAVQMMPVADCPGLWNWGYDGVCLYAPNRNYGRPEDLRFFINKAHELGLAVYLDVVYNHFGPDGAYHRLYHPEFFAADVQTPWGDGLNFHGPGSANTRAFFVENGLYWLHEYHADGFRLDATHAIVDTGEYHFLAQYAAAIHRAAEATGRPCRVIAEDARNLIHLLQPPEAGGYGLDGVWADDFHHQVRHALAGDIHGYYADFEGTPADIARTLRNGWFFDGQMSKYHGHPRGTPTGDMDRRKFVICIQNHDQIGNRARGERLHHQVSPEAFRAASTLLLLAPESPMLFMGQEWASSSPFQFFTDHHPGLGRLVSEGRVREFAHFPEFADPASRATIPDPQAESTYRHCVLRWAELTEPGPWAMLAWYRALLALRREIVREPRKCTISDRDGWVLIEWRGLADTILAAVRLTAADGLYGLHGAAELRLTSEDPGFAVDSAPPRWDAAASAFELQRPGAAIFTIPEGGLE